jgi:hypothetical protein
MTAAFLAGFIVDNFTLTRIDLAMTVIVLSTYLFVATLGFVLASISRGGALVPYATQFAFGSLLSGYFIFFTRSASLAGSWFFIFLLIIAIFGNEFLKEEYRRFELRATMLFAAFFFFAIIYVPVALKSMGAWMFLLSGLVSLASIWVVIRVIGRVAPEVVRTTRRTLIITIGGLFAGVNGLYFANIIPPIPLSLKDAGVYHFVSRAEVDGYTGRAEPVKWYDVLGRYHPQFHCTQGGPVFFYSAVFAPTALNTTILHEWQYYNELLGAWVTTDRLGFQITGGRDGGYRGYSVKQSILPGLWRVNVITERGQLVGRITFTVIDVPGSPLLVTRPL